jgi:hypothetical protein
MPDFSGFLSFKELLEAFIVCISHVYPLIEKRTAVYGFGQVNCFSDIC